jgi:hypothetical protein
LSLKFLFIYCCGVRKEKILKTPCPIGFGKKKKKKPANIITKLITIPHTWQNLNGE